MSIGEKLKKLRTEADISQRKISKLLGLDSTVYGKYERDERTPTIEIIAKIADYFGVSVDYLIGRTDTQYNSKLNVPSFLSLNGLSPEAIKELVSYKEYLIKKYKK